MRHIFPGLLLVISLTIIFFLLPFFHVGFLIFNLYLVFFLVILLLILSAIWPPESPWAPWWRTDNKTAEAIVSFAKIGKGSVVYDLGCGDGEVLLACAKKGARGVGIEIDPLRFWISKARAYKNGLGSLKFVRGNFFDQDLSEANVIIVYLIPKTLNKLLPKFRKELKKGAKIISYRYEMNMRPWRIDKKNELFLYKI